MCGFYTSKGQYGIPLRGLCFHVYSIPKRGDCDCWLEATGSCSFFLERMFGIVGHID